MHDALATIARLYLEVDTLAIPGRDHLDCHELDVQSLREALTAAYYAGYAASVRAANGSVTERLVTERHTLRNGIWLHPGAVASEDAEDAETVVTLPLPEQVLLQSRWREQFAREVLLPAIIAQRRIG